MPSILCDSPMRQRCQSLIEAHQMQCDYLRRQLRAERRLTGILAAAVMVLLVVLIGRWL